MNTLKAFLASAALGTVALAAAAPAAAQVNGIATTDPATAIAASQARQTAYQQIETTYAAQIQSVQQKRQQAQEIGKQFDTDGDGQVSEQEEITARTANSAAYQQVGTIQREITQLTQPIAVAQIYALEQISAQFGAAQQQVVSDKKISLILTPESFIYAPAETDITSDIVTALNARIPAVSTAVPANWQPQRQSQQLHQRIQEILLLGALQQQRAAQAQQQPTTTQQPAGR